MMTRPLGDMLTEVAGSLLALNDDAVNGGEQLLRATSIELTLPIDVRVNRSTDGLTFCADVPIWRWRTDFDAPYGQLKVKLEEAARQETDDERI